MQEISCPKCSAAIPLSVDRVDDRGRARLSCAQCGANVLVKVNERALKLSPEIPPTPPDADTDVPDAVPLDPTAPWAVVVYAFEEGGKPAARRALMALPRFRTNPNKLHAVLQEPPFIIDGLKHREAVLLEEEFQDLQAQIECGPQEWLLDEDLEPIPRELRGPRPVLADPDEGDSDASTREPANLEIAFDFSEERSEAWMEFDRPVAAVESGEEVEEDEPVALFGDDVFLGVADDDPEDDFEPEPAGNLFALDDEDDEGSSRFADTSPASLEEAITPVAANDLPDTEESADQRLSREAMFPILTVDVLPGFPRVIGGVDARVAVASADIGAAAERVIGQAMATGRASLRERAEAMGGAAVVGLRSSQSAVPGPSGWLWILVLSGTVVAQR